MTGVEWFQNHEIVKIVEPNGLLLFGSIWAVILILIILTAKKTKDKKLLNRDVTDQAKGWAIISIVVGHTSSYVLASRGGVIQLAVFGVSLFFMLSGFGIALSYRSGKINLKEFALKRISRLMIPYWIITVIIICMDYFILSKKYAGSDLALTFLGINLTKTTWYIDYVRWFVTAIIIWYVLFYVAWKFLKGTKALFALLFAGIVLLLFSRYIHDIGYSFLPFPVGVLLAAFYAKIVKSYNKISKQLIFLSSVIVMIFSVLILFIHSEITNCLPQVIVEFIYQELLPILFSLAALILLSVLSKLTSSFLKLIGKYSLEIFLIHGVLLVRYDTILFRGPLYITFWIYLALVLLFAVILRKVVFDKITKMLFKNSA